MNLPNGWTLIGGLPVLADGDACVVAIKISEVLRCELYEKGVFVDYDDASYTNPPVAFSPEHLGVGAELLRDWQAKEAEKRVKEVFRLPQVTVFEDQESKRIASCMVDVDSWRIIRPGAIVERTTTRELAEAAARKALMEAK